MFLRKIFHKIKIAFARRNGKRIPYVPPEKRYGNFGEEAFVARLKRLLPECDIKTNVVIESPRGIAEIDCVILYKNKLFAVEIKSLKGKIIECSDGFVKEKTDVWTGETHVKYMKSPFRQLNRAIYLLKNQTESEAWINPIVFFESDGSEILIGCDNVWFDNISELARYLEYDGRRSSHYAAAELFKECVAADCLYDYESGRALKCVISDDSLEFIRGAGALSRENILEIHIRHRLTYDELSISTADGEYKVREENAAIRVRADGITTEYSLNRLDRIVLGK